MNFNFAFSFFLSFSFSFFGHKICFFATVLNKSYYQTEQLAWKGKLFKRIGLNLWLLTCTHVLFKV